MLDYNKCGEQAEEILFNQLTNLAKINQSLINSPIALVLEEAKLINKNINLMFEIYKVIF